MGSKKKILLPLLFFLFGFGACGDSEVNPSEEDSENQDSQQTPTPADNPDPKPSPSSLKETGLCTNQRDDDGDGGTDCADTDCASDAFCAPVPLSVPPLVPPPTPPVIPPPPPPQPQPAEILSFTSNSNCVSPEAPQITLQWETRNSTQVTLNGQVVSSAGSQTVSPTAPTTYTLEVVKENQRTSQIQRILFKTRMTALEPIAHSFPWEITDVKMSHDGTMLVLTNGRVFKKTPQTQNFTELHPDATISQWNTIAIHPTNSQIMYAGTTGWVHRSTDGGGTWPDLIILERLRTPLVPNTLFIPQAELHLVYIGFQGGGFLLNTTARTLTLLGAGSVPTIRRENILHFDKNPHNSNEVLAANEFELFQSLDGGNTWSIPSVPDWGEIYSMKHVSDGFYLSTETGLYVTRPNQPPWQLEQGLQTPVYDAERDAETGTLFAATDEGIYINGGSRWTKFANHPAQWLFDTAGHYPVAVSHSNWMTFQERVFYSDTCPQEPNHLSLIPRGRGEMSSFLPASDSPLFSSGEIQLY